jgi:hypothetical protein
VQDDLPKLHLFRDIQYRMVHGAPVFLLRTSF